MSEGLKQKIQKEIDGNIQMLRSKDPKSERRISVLHARIEMLTWVRKELDEATNHIQDEFDQEIKMVRAVCHNYLKEVLSEDKLQDVVIFHLNNLRKRLAVLGVDGKEKARA